MPILRLPFHLSYVLWLSRFSKSLAKAYLRFALTMCRLRGVEPCYLLHPLDFLGREDITDLAFFPGMDLPREHKLEMVETFLDMYTDHFDVVTLLEHVRRVRAKGLFETVASVGAEN
jgi:hypothetical protein